MSGQTPDTLRVPLPGGNLAVYNGSGLYAYLDADWLGSLRFSSFPNRTMNWDLAYAPYGEEYAVDGSGTSFAYTGQFAELADSRLWDFPFGEQHSSQGRWISPDPAGVAAVNPMNPQSWNRYAYVAGNPLNAIDPNGTGGEEGEPPAGMPVDDPIFFNGLFGSHGEHYLADYRNANRAKRIAANNGKPLCISTSSLNWSQKAQLTAAQFYANLTGWTFGFGAGLDAGAGIGPKGSKWNFGLGGSGSTLIVADASGDAGFLNSVSGGFSAVKMGGTGRWGAGAAAGPSFLVSPNPISTIAGPSGSISAGGGAVLGAGFSLTTSGAATFTFGVGAGAEAGISPQGGTSQFIPFCHN